jgi:hypothetical protein
MAGWAAADLEGVIQGEIPWKRKGYNMLLSFLLGSGFKYIFASTVPKAPRRD